MKYEYIIFAYKCFHYDDTFDNDYVILYIFYKALPNMVIGISIYHLVFPTGN